MKWFLAGFLVLAGVAALGDHTGPGLVSIVLGGLIIWTSVKRTKPQPLPAPSEHRSARIEARRIERRAEQKAERMVAHAVAQADEQGRAAIQAAQAQLAAESTQKWVS